VFFGSLCAVALVRLQRSSAIYVFADDGIRFPMHGYATVPWSRVEGVRIFWASGQRFLGVDITDPESLAVGRGSLAQRALRSNLRRGRGALTIPEAISPGSLEELAAEIDRRRVGQPATTVVVTSPPSAGGKFWLVVRSPAAAVAVHGFFELTVIGRSSGPCQAVRRAVFAVLLLGGAVLVSRRPRLGVPLVVATEVAIVGVALFLGHYAVSLRILSLFYPVVVLGRLAGAIGRPPQGPAG